MLSVALTPDGRWVLSGSKDRGVQFWDPQSGNTQLMLQGHKNSGTCLRRLVLVTWGWIRLTRVSVCHRSYLGRTKSDGNPFCDGQRRYAGPNLEVSLRVFFLVFSPHYSLCHSPEISPPSPLSRPLALAARVCLFTPHSGRPSMTPTPRPQHWATRDQPYLVKIFSLRLTCYFSNISYKPYHGP